MARNLADLKAECIANGLAVVQSGKREAKSDYESALRKFYWEKEHPGLPLLNQHQPMLARNAKDLTEDEQSHMWRDNGSWVAQEKLDGCRCILQINPSVNPFRKATEVRNELTSRRMSDQTYRLNELTDKLAFYRDFPFPPEWYGAVVDGEVIMPVAEVNTGDTTTKNVLQATAATLNSAPDKANDIQRRHGVMRFQAFDLLSTKGGVDIRNYPYSHRYQLLTELVTAFNVVCQANGWPVP